MKTTRPHINPLPVTLFLALLASIIIVGLGITAGAGAHSATAPSDQAFEWPVKPFDQPHPVRGSFGDPRTVFKAPPTVEGMLTGDGSFSFHQGVDISAPDGTAVYPVQRGIVSYVASERVCVASSRRLTFEYWHIRPAVRVGQPVEPGQTVLGHILREAGHVHLTQVVDGRAVNPLAPGRLTPYADRTRPWIASISLRRTETGRTELPSFLRGRFYLIVEAYDTPNRAVPGVWHGLPVTPARITWRIQTLKGKLMIRRWTGRDVRERLPNNSQFWRYYARGTYQNMAVFGRHYSFRQGGCYLFKLTPEPFDTGRLRDGVYDLIVTASDVAGNSGSRTLRITVHNRPGWVGS